MPKPTCTGATHNNTLPSPVVCRSPFVAGKAGKSLSSSRPDYKCVAGKSLSSTSRQYRQQKHKLFDICGIQLPFGLLSRTGPSWTQASGCRHRWGSLIPRIAVLVLKPAFAAANAMFALHCLPASHRRPHRSAPPTPARRAARVTAQRCSPSGATSRRRPRFGRPSSQGARHTSTHWAVCRWSPMLTARRCLDCR